MAGRKPNPALTDEALDTALDAFVEAGKLRDHGRTTTGARYAITSGRTLVELRTPREALVFAAGLSVDAPAPQEAAKPKAVKAA